MPVPLQPLELLPPPAGLGFTGSAGGVIIRVTMSFFGMRSTRKYCACLSRRERSPPQRSRTCARTSVPTRARSVFANSTAYRCVRAQLSEWEREFKGTEKKDCVLFFEGKEGEWHINGDSSKLLYSNGGGGGGGSSSGGIHLSCALIICHTFKVC